MTTTNLQRSATTRQSHAGTSAPVDGTALSRALAALRIAFGLTFLWAFFDKLLALGFATGAITNPKTGARTGIDFLAQDQAWVNGGSPTKGFLTFGVPAHNPFHDVFVSMAGATWADWLFMLGLLGVGTALTLGITMRLGTACGALLYALMWVASWPLENNPVIDDHLLGLISMIVLGLALAGDTWGLGKVWARTGIVTRFPVLR